MPRIGKSTKTQHRLVVIRDRGTGKRDSNCLMGKWFASDVSKMLWNLEMVVTQNCECTKYY